MTTSAKVEVEAAAEGWTVMSAMTVLRRRRALLLWPLGVMLLLAATYCCLATRRYKATGQIQVHKEASGGFGLESSVMGREDDSISSDSLDYNITLQTEVGILESEALALTVVRDLHLESTHDYFPQHESLGSAPLFERVVAALPSFGKPLEPLSVPLARAPNRRSKVLKIFAAHLKVQPVTGTRLIDISYKDPDPELAAAVVNKLIVELGEFTFEQRFTSTAQGSAWLSGQLADLKQQMQQLQSRAIALQRDTGMFGEDASRNVVLERLASLNQTLTEAESNRILKEAIDRVAASGDPELISSLSGNSSVGAVASITNALTLIQGLRSQEANLRAQLAQDSIRYGPAYPRLAESQAQLLGVQRSIQEEVRRLGGRAHSDYLVAMREEQGARAAFDAQKQQAERLNDSMLAYGLAKQEADSSREIYESLLAKLKQAGVLEGLKASNISTVALAQVPPPNYPSSPRIPLVLAAGMLGGLLIGGLLVGVAELTDDTLRELEGIERSLEVPLIAVLPLFDQKGRARPRHLQRLLRRVEATDNTREERGPLKVAALEKRNATFAEGLRALRTALLLSRSGNPPKVILITSCLAREGKTTLAMNLAVMFAQGGARVLLVDADMRNPSVADLIGGAQGPGLATALTSGDAPAVRLPTEAAPTLAVLCGTELPPLPADLLGSMQMRTLVAAWREEYEFVVLDGPPVLPVTDSVLLSQLSDATLLVSRHGQTTRQALRRSAETLKRQLPRGAALGVVLNGVSDEAGEFYQYFGYPGRVHAQQIAQA